MGVADELPGELGQLLRGFATRAERVVTFLAVLEMTRLGWLHLVQAEDFGAVAIESRVPADQDLGAVRGEVFEEQVG